MRNYDTQTALDIEKVVTTCSSLQSELDDRVLYVSSDIILRTIRDYTTATEDEVVKVGTGRNA